MAVVPFSAHFKLDACAPLPLCYPLNSTESSRTRDALHKMAREIRTQNVTYNARSWADTIFRLRGSVLPEVLPHLIVTGLISVGVWQLDKTAKFIEIDKTGHSMFAFFVTFLVIFRVNSSVAAYVKGRNELSRFHFVVVEILRKYIPSTSSQNAPNLVSDMRRQLLLSFSLLVLHLRDTFDTHQATAFSRLAARGVSLLATGSREDKALRAAYQRSKQSFDQPTLALAMVTSDLYKQEKDGLLDSNIRKDIDSCIASLHNIILQTDEIKTAQIPFQYVQMQRMFMCLFLYTIPFALVRSLGFIAIPVVMMLTFGYVGLDKTGDSLEDPFGTDLCDLPLENYLQRMSETSRSLVLTRYGNTEKIAALVPDVDVRIVGGSGGGGGRGVAPSAIKPSGSGAGGYQQIASLNTEPANNEV